MSSMPSAPQRAMAIPAPLRNMVTPLDRRATAAAITARLVPWLTMVVLITVSSLARLCLATGDQNKPQSLTYLWLRAMLKKVTSLLRDVSLDRRSPSSCSAAPFSLNLISKASSQSLMWKPKRKLMLKPPRKPKLIRKLQKPPRLLLLKPRLNQPKPKLKKSQRMLLSRPLVNKEDNDNGYIHRITSR